jgi:hypothetical protein
VSPGTVYWLSFAVFGLAAVIDVGLDIATGTIGVGTAAAFAGVLALAYVIAVALRAPEQAPVPRDWGLLVLFVSAGALLYVVGLSLEVYSLVS